MRAPNNGDNFPPLTADASRIAVPTGAYANAGLCHPQSTGFVDCVKSHG